MKCSLLLQGHRPDPGRPVRGRPLDPPSGRQRPLAGCGRRDRTYSIRGKA